MSDRYTKETANMDNIAEKEIFHLFDKYIKENNNFLPLQAYLQCLETSNTNSNVYEETFSSICTFKTASNIHYSAPQPSSAQSSTCLDINPITVKTNANNNMTSTLALIKSKSKNEEFAKADINDNQNQYVLAQKLYKIIISIDYSPHTSSFEFIKKSLDSIFEKLSHEYDDFFLNCANLEPQIYVTVLLWNTNYFQYNNNKAYNDNHNPQHHNSFNDQYKYNYNRHQTSTYSKYVSNSNQTVASIPFTIICHSKRLLKSNIGEIASHIYEKTNELKFLFFEQFSKPTNDLSSSHMEYINEHQQYNGDYFKRSSQKYNIRGGINSTKINSPFETLLFNIIKIFSFFGLNECSSASTSLAISHHIHITDGLIYATDMIKCLEKMSKSSISFSFIYSGSSQLSSGRNISSGFGLLADHYFMRTLAHVTNGFYAVIDENLDCLFISSRRLLYHFNLIQTCQTSKLTLFSNTQNPQGQNPSNNDFLDNSVEDFSSANESSKNNESKTSIFSSSDEQGFNDETRDSFCQKNKLPKRAYNENFNQMTSKTVNYNQQHKYSKKKKSDTANTKSADALETEARDQYITSLFTNDLNLNDDQPIEVKCVQKYELTQKIQTIKQIARMRAFEGFYLIKVTKELVKRARPKNSSSFTGNSTVTSPSKISLSTSATTAISFDNYYFITLYFRRYFTQTVKFIYKISYYVPCNETANKSEGASGGTQTTETSSSEKIDIPSSIVNNRNDRSNIDSATSANENSPSSSSSLKKSSRQQNKKETNVASPNNNQFLSKYLCEIWISWNFLHLKSKYQNSVLIENIRQHLSLIQKSDFDRTHGLITTQMLNPPDILKLKEPLFKLSTNNQFNEASQNNRSNIYYTSNEFIDSSNKNPTGSVLFPMQNLNFELNIRTNKNTEQEFIEFAKSWLMLAFFKYNKKTLDKSYGLHTIKLILDYDRPLPDTNTVLFDMKNTFMLMQYELMANKMSISQVNSQRNSFYDNNMNNSYDYLNVYYNNSANQQQQQHQHHHHHHSNTFKNNIFQCQNSLNKICVMLVGYCDIMLVENCVFLKFLEASSTKFVNNATTKISYRRKSKSMAPSTSGPSVRSASSNNEKSAKSQPISPNDTSDSRLNINSDTPTTDSEISSSKKANESSNRENKDNEDDENSNSMASNEKINKIIDNSFVIIRLDTINVPYVSLHFVFHSSINYSDRVAIIESLKEKLHDLNVRSSLPSSSGFGNSANSLLTVNNNLQGTNLNSVNNMSSEDFQNPSQHHKSKASINNDFNDTCQILQKKNLFHTLKLTFLDDNLDIEAHYQQQQQLLLLNQSNKKTNSMNNLLNINNEAAYWFKSSATILNFMLQRKFKWTISKQFSMQTAQQLKETLIDTFIRVRLKEGFRCLFKFAKFAVFTLQLPMFDSGEVYFNQTSQSDGSKVASDLTKDIASKPQQQSSPITPSSQSNLNSFKNGSSQICSFVYVVRFFNNSTSNNQPNLSNCNYLPGAINNNKIGLNQYLPLHEQNKAGLLNLIQQPSQQAEILENLNKKSMNEHNFIGQQETQEPEEEVFFTTELYIEAIDGIYQKRKSNYSNNFSSNFSYLGSKKTNLNASNSNNVNKDATNDYFKNLNNIEIANLIYLIDLKSCLTLQSSQALFLAKSNLANSNLVTLIDFNGNKKPTPSFTNNNQLNEIISNISNYSTNYLDSIRLLPDLNMIPKANFVRFSNNKNLTSSKSIHLTRSTHLQKRIEYVKPSAAIPSASLSQSTASFSKNNDIKLTRTDPFSSSLSKVSSLNTSSNNISTEQDTKKSFLMQSTTKKNNKNEVISLHDQLRPVLNSISFSNNNNNSPITNINFQFTLRGILLESQLYVCVFDDIPFTLFTKSASATSESIINEQLSMKRIQELFFESIDENFKKMNIQSNQSSSNQHVKNAAPLNTNIFDSTSNKESFNQVQEIKNELKNAIITKLADIKCGDLIAKQIVDDLRLKIINNHQNESASNQEADKSNIKGSNFQFYLKFNINQMTSKEVNLGSGINSSTNKNNSSSKGYRHHTTSTTNWYKPNYNNQNHQSSNSQNENGNESLNNNFLIHGFFFLNSSSQSQFQSNTRSNTHQNNVSTSSCSSTDENQKTPKNSRHHQRNEFSNNSSPFQYPSNRLVMFLFNCVPENIKHSLINTAQTNTFLIRKSLFKTSSSIFCNNDNLNYRFYCSKKVTDLRKLYKEANSTTNTTNLIGPKKNSSSLSEILKHHLVTNSFSSDNNLSIGLFFLTYLDSIEEICTKSYIKSVIQYIGLYSIQSKAQTNFIKFEMQPINQLLRIGQKTKLLDIDLTEYLKILCSHISETNNSKHRDSMTSQYEEDNDEDDEKHLIFDFKRCKHDLPYLPKHQYLEEKFNEVFLSNFNLLPGFNDLFIFTSSQHTNEYKKQRSQNIYKQRSHTSETKKSLNDSLINSGTDSLSTQDHDEVNCEYDDDNDYDDYDDDDEDEDFDEQNQSLPQYTVDNSGLIPNNSNSDSDDYLYELDNNDDDLDFVDFMNQNEQNLEEFDQRRRHRRRRRRGISSKSKRNKSLESSNEASSNKYSSPYIKQESRTLRPKLSQNNFNQFDSLSDLSYMREQIIGLEFVTVINTEETSFDDTTNLINVDLYESNRRTRTTTLTPDCHLIPEETNNLGLLTPGINIGFYDQINQQLPNETLVYNNNEDLLMQRPSNLSELSKNQLAKHSTKAAAINTTTRKHQHIFYSKFNKFNRKCLIDLIDEKDQHQFQNLLKKLSLENLKNIKVYLRFNWYSFNELNNIFGPNNNPTAAQVSNFLNSKSPFKIPEAKQPIFLSRQTSAQHHPFYIDPANSQSASSLPLSSSSTVLNNNYQNQQIQHQLSILTNTTSISATATNAPFSNRSTNSNLRLSLTNTTTTSTTNNLNNPLNNNNSRKSNAMYSFEYNYLLNPKINEFKWHLRDEIFQSHEEIKFKGSRMFCNLMMHIKEGVKRKYPHCHYDIKRILLNKFITTTTTTTVDPKPMTNAAKLLSTKTSTKTQTEEDKSILSVDTEKFFHELLHIIKHSLDGQYYDCKLQQINDSFYLNCRYRRNESSFTFKILINIAKHKKIFNQDIISQNQQQQQQSQQQVKRSNEQRLSLNKSPSPTSTSTINSPSIELNQNNNNFRTTRKVSISQQNQHQHMSNSVTEPLIKGNLAPAPAQLFHRQMSIQTASKQQQHLPSQTQQQQQQQQPPPVQIKQEIVTNEIKLKLYYDFDNSKFCNNEVVSKEQEALTKELITEFSSKLDELIKLVYLKLSLKEIHDSRKWNNMLYLKSKNEANEKNNQEQLQHDETNSSIKSSDLSEKLMNNNKSLTLQDTTITASNQNKLACNCVWSVLFKLHRLHQTMQRIHSSNDQQHQMQEKQSQSSASNQSQSKPISQGLKKLQDLLNNFKIDDSVNCGDLYAYEKKNEIFLLRLEEIYEHQAPSLLTNQNFISNESSHNTHDQSKSSNVLSRRPSYASIADSELNKNTQSDQSNKSSNQLVNKSQNLSGGSTTVANQNTSGLPTASNINTISGLVGVPSGTLGSGVIGPSGVSQKSEYIRLSVYGLQEPDDEMKDELCKLLQSELDYSLLIKMCGSIEKNTYKTSSAQHPDKITEEDLSFFKQICDNYFDFEIPLPFVLNFNRTLRENFFYFVKQIFNTSFKAIDSPISLTSSFQLALNNFPNQIKKQFQMSNLNLNQQSQLNLKQSQLNVEGKDNEYDELNKLLCHDSNDTTSAKTNVGEKISNRLFPLSTTTTQPVSSTFAQQLSFSFMSMQPPLGPYDSKANTLSNTQQNKNFTSNLNLNKNNRGQQQLTADFDPYLIQLSRIFFHNSKSLIGKQASLVLVEAYYAIKGLEYLVSSKITRSSSIGASNTDLFNINSDINKHENVSKHSSPNQILETCYTPARQAGPTFVFRFYCRGENDTNSYKESLKLALNNALIYFLSEYLTKIEPELYLKKIFLKKQPAVFRIAAGATATEIQSNEKIAVTNSSDEDKMTSQQQSATKLNRKRHKSMGNERTSSSPIEHSSFIDDSSLLKMNMSARETKLGKLFVNQKIKDEHQLNTFIVSNFAYNSFDHHDYGDTIEYFRESLKSFDYCKIFNNLINQQSPFSFLSTYIPSDSSTTLNASKTTEDNPVNESEDPTSPLTDEDNTDLLNTSSISITSTTSLNMMGSRKDSRSLSVDDNKQGTDQPSNNALFKSLIKKDLLKNQMRQSNYLYQKSYLRIIYDWLKGLYLIQMRHHHQQQVNANKLSSISSSINQQSLSSSLNLGKPHVSASSNSPTLLLSPQIIQSPIILSTQNSVGSSSSNSSSGVLSSASSVGGGINNSSTFILRKKFNYLTKYNLTTLMREVEHGLRDMSKCEVTACYYTFKTEATKVKQTKPTIPKNPVDDQVFFEDNKKLIEDTVNFQQKSRTGQELKSCLRNKFSRQYSENMTTSNNTDLNTQTNSFFYLNDECDFGSRDFSDLKQTSFWNLHENLSKSENIIITLNVEHASTATAAGPVSASSSATSAPNYTSTNIIQNNSSSSGTGTITSSIYNRVPSFSGTTNSGITKESSTGNNVMIKSMSSNSGELDSSMSLSNSMALVTLQLKRTYIYTIVHAKNRTVTFYCFTTESSNYDSIKQMLDQSADSIMQRYHLVNNTVLYKYGGLIGENLLYDLKRVKTLTISACCLQQQQQQNQHQPKNSNLNFNFNESLNETLTNSSSSISTTTSNTTGTTTTNQNNSATIYSLNNKLSKSPTIYRQFSYKSGASNINSSLISSLQFSSSNETKSSLSINTSNSATSANITTLSIKPLYIAQFCNKQYDSIVNIINQQIGFCAQYLSSTSSSSSSSTSIAPSSGVTAANLISASLVDLSTGSNTSAMPLNLNSSLFLNKSINLSNPTSAASRLSIHQMTQNISSNLVSNNNGAVSNSLYGVGLFYQLYEIQHIYRHPRKIYEFAVSQQQQFQQNNQMMNNQQNRVTQNYGSNSKTSNASTSSTSSTKSSALSGQQQSTNKQSTLNINDFYKNYILPVLIPVHYCCTPILFYPNWNESFITEKMLKINGASALNPNLLSNVNKLTSNNSTTNLNAPPTTSQMTSLMNPNELTWYLKMRQIVMIEYARFFESRGFLRLKDEKSSLLLDSNYLIRQQQHASNNNNSSSQMNLLALESNQVHHFIKWIQQDGFFYITISLDEIFLHVKLGYCARYRATSNSFINELVQFFQRDFHVHSFVYDFHLTAINKNFSASITGGSQIISSTSQIISKFLNEFVEFFMTSRRTLPSFSNNKIFKIVHEKADSSLIPHQFRLIFDIMIDSKKHSEATSDQTSADTSTANLSFKTLYVFDNNIAIYNLIDNNCYNLPSKQQQQPKGSISHADYAKYLVVKIENYSVTKVNTNTTNSLAASVVMQSFNTSQNVASSIQQSHSSKKPRHNESIMNLSKLSDSSSSLSYNVNQSQVLGSQALSSHQQHPSSSSSNQVTTEPFIRMVCYYLCIYKPNQQQQQQQQHQKYHHLNEEENFYLNQKFNEELQYINKVIERSINVYKQEMFWDNITLSMSSFKNIVNETNTGSSTTSSIFFKVNSQELEQILDISQKIDILELDAGLTQFLKQCYSIKERIRNYLKLSFGRHFIYASSNTMEYCLLLINDELIRTFRHSESSPLVSSSTFEIIDNTTQSENSISSSSLNQTTNDSQLKSFVLLKFDKLNETSQLLQVNRVKMNNNVADQQQQLLSSNSNLPKRSNTIDLATLNVSSSIKLNNEILFTSSQRTESNQLKENKYLNFTVNNLMYVLWESLFFPN